MTVRKIGFLTMLLVVAMAMPVMGQAAGGAGAGGGFAGVWHAVGKGKAAEVIGLPPFAQSPHGRRAVREGPSWAKDEAPEAYFSVALLSGEPT